MKCLHQIIRPSGSLKFDGHGDCRVCQPGPANKNCSGYQPIDIQIITFLVVDAVDKEQFLKKRS